MGLDRHRYRGSCPPQKSLGRKVSSAKLFTLLMQKPWKGGLPAAVVAAQCLAWARGSGELLAKAPFPAPFLPLLPQTQQKQWPEVSRACFSCPSPLLWQKQPTPRQVQFFIHGQQFNPAYATEKSWAAFHGKTGGKSRWGGNIGFLSFRPVISTQLSV